MVVARLLGLPFCGEGVDSQRNGVIGWEGTPKDVYNHLPEVCHAASSMSVGKKKGINRGNVCRISRNRAGLGHTEVPAMGVTSE